MKVSGLISSGGNWVHSCATLTIFRPNSDTPKISEIIVRVFILPHCKFQESGVVPRPNISSFATSPAKTGALPEGRVARDLGTVRNDQALTSHDTVSCAEFKEKCGSSVGATTEFWQCSGSPSRLDAGAATPFRSSASKCESYV